MGSGDMLEVAHMGLHVAQMTEPRRHARLLRGGDGERGAHPAASTATASRPAAMPIWSCCRPPIRSRRSALQATRLQVIRRGKVIAETPAAVAKLGIAGRPAAVELTRALPA